MSRETFQDTSKPSLTMAGMNLGQRIKKARKEKGLTQEKLGELLGVTKGAVNNWERNSDEPTFKNVKNLSEVLGVSIVSLISDEDIKHPELHVGSPRRLLSYSEAQLIATDPYMARVVEDLIDILVSSDLISEDRLPPEAQQLLQHRRNLRTVT